MMTSIQRAALVAGVLALALAQGCATRVKATATSNPPPAVAFKQFSRIEVKRVQAGEAVKSSAGLEKVQANLDKDLEVSLKEWNAGADNGRKLTVTPVVEQLELTRTASRVLLGPLAGSSGVLLRLTITDEKGTVIAKPEFFQRADAMAAGFVMGVHDGLMMMRVANLASGYLKANYLTAVGGPTGADAKALGQPQAAAQ